MPLLTVTDYVLTGAGKAGLYVQLRDNVNPAITFTSTTPTDSNGQFSIAGPPPPPADYAAYTSPLTGSGAVWTLYDPHFRISYTRGDTIIATVQAITEATLVAGLDASAGEVVTVTLTANRVVGLPANPTAGQTIELIVTQGGAGSFTLTWPGGIKTAWQPAGAVGAISSLKLRYYGVNWQQVAGQVAVSDAGVLSHRGPAVVGSLTVIDPSISPYAAWPGNPTGAIQNTFYVGPPAGGGTDDAIAINAVTLAASNASGRATVVFPGATWLTQTTTNFYGNTRYEFAALATIKYSGAGDACLIGNQKNTIWDSLVVDLTGAGTNAVGLHIKGLWFAELREPKVIFSVGASSQTGILIETAVNAAVLDWGSFVLRIILPDLASGLGAYGIRAIKSAGGANLVTHLAIEDGWINGKGYAINLDSVSTFRILGTTLAGPGANDGIFCSNSNDGILSPGEIASFTGWGINFGAGNSGIDVLTPSHASPGGAAGYMNTATYYPTTYERNHVRLFGSRTDQTYFFDLQSVFAYGQSLKLDVNGGGSLATILEYGDTAGLTLRGSGNSTPAKKVSVDGPLFARRGYQTPTEAVLVSGVDASLGEDILVTLTANRVVGLPLNPLTGQELTITAIQGGAGAFSLGWNAGFKNTWSDAGNVAGKRSTIVHWYDGTNWNQKSAQTTYV